MWLAHQLDVSIISQSTTSPQGRKFEPSHISIKTSAVSLQPEIFFVYTDLQHGDQVSDLVDDDLLSIDRGVRLTIPIHQSLRSQHTTGNIKIPPRQLSNFAAWLSCVELSSDVLKAV
jgi:hypothetical protein